MQVKRQFKRIECTEYARIFDHSCGFPQWYDASWRCATDEDSGIFCIPVCSVEKDFGDFRTFFNLYVGWIA